MQFSLATLFRLTTVVTAWTWLTITIPEIFVPIALALLVPMVAWRWQSPQR